MQYSVCISKGKNIVIDRSIVHGRRRWVNKLLYYIVIETRRQPTTRLISGLSPSSNAYLHSATVQIVHRTSGCRCGDGDSDSCDSVCDRRSRRICFGAHTLSVAPRNAQQQFNARSTNGPLCRRKDSLAETGEIKENKTLLRIHSAYARLRTNISYSNHTSCTS